jgi:FMN-dependent NADH-azoreductase
MSTLLVLASSALGDASVSNELLREAVAALRARDPELRILMRDLGGDPIPHLTRDSATAIRGAEPANEAQAAARSLSEALIAELQTADRILIGAPMYNFGMPTTLKVWFDYILRAGLTFRYTESGPVGLMTGKRALVIATRGGLYSEGPAQALDSQEPHLRNLLGFMGITDVAFVRAERLAIGPEIRAQSIETARAQLREIIDSGWYRAA